RPFLSAPFWPIIWLKLRLNKAGVRSRTAACWMLGHDGQELSASAEAAHPQNPPCGHGQCAMARPEIAGSIGRGFNQFSQARQLCSYRDTDILVGRMSVVSRAQ